MGFWHTGYIEFHEPVGLEESYVCEPPSYYCKHCKETFTTADALRTHRFENHPYIRPILFLRGIEVGTTPLRIIKPLKTEDIHIGHCKDMWLNGMPVSLDGLVDKLVSTMNDTVMVKLANEGVHAEFQLCFEIAREVDLAGVDRCFFETARRGRLDKRSVEDFIESAQTYSSAIRYLDGICEYFYGVLIKEDPSKSSLPYEEYRNKFNRAEDALKDFDQSLARTIVALISFHFNRFYESVNSARGSRVSIASGRFERWIAKDVVGANSLLSQKFDAGVEKLFTDYEAERLISWCVSDKKVLISHMKNIESLIHKDITEFDRTKLHVLLAECFVELGDRENAICHARDLRNNPTFGQWAESVIERSKAQNDLMRSSQNVYS